MNEKDLVPSGLFSGKPDKGRRGFFAKLAALVAVPKVLEQAYQEPEEIPINSVLLSGNTQAFSNQMMTTASRLDWAAASAFHYFEPEEEEIRKQIDWRG